MIAVSMNVGGGVRLIKPAKLYICTQTHYKHDEDGRTVLDVCGHGSIPLSHSGNVVTRIGLHTYLNCQITVYLKKCYRKDDYTVDCPHLIKKRLCKTRIVDFHWAKLAISEILLLYFQGIWDSIVSGRKFYYEKIIAIFLWYVYVRCVCGGGGGGTEWGRQL